MNTAYLAWLAFEGMCWLLAAAWLVQAGLVARGMPTLPDLTKMGDELPAVAAGAGPDVTVVVPACNEEATIVATLQSLLASTGVGLQVIAVDDRSTDGTGACMESVAAEWRSSGGAHTLEVIHVQELPQGWLGKPHAMAIAAERARAPWLLFTDGDVLFVPNAMELALRQAQAVRADHLILVPTLILKSAGERAMLAAMQVLSQWTIRLWRVANPKAKDFMGVGGFNLIRHDAYRQVGGFEALRMEVLDDLRLGWKVKRAGLRQHVALGPGLVRIRWIEGSLAVVRLVEKNGFAVYRFRLGLTLLACIGLALHAVFPVVAMIVGGWTALAGVLTYAGIAMVYEGNRRVTQVSAWHAVLFAPAVAVVIIAFLRSALLTLTRGGVMWRGTLYPLSELRRAAGRGW
jgi:glycosyltransferase involved in cell wall biosynthesis